MTLTRSGAATRVMAAVVGLVLLPACRCEPEPAAPNATPGASAEPSSSASTVAAAPLPPAALEAPVHLPASLAAGKKAPLLVMLHGLGSSGEDIEASDWPSFAASHGVAWMAPSGPKDSKGRRFWNAGKSCCNFDSIDVDHVAQLRTLIAHAIATNPIDAAHVFIGGYSNGGFMSHRFACEAPDLIAGIVSIAGSGPLEAVHCKSAKSLRILQVQGDADPIVPYGGGHLFNNPQLPEHASAQKTVSDWAARLDCDPTPKSDAPFDFEARLPGTETQPSHFANCKAGRVALWTVHGGDHFVGFRSPGPEAIWRFLTE